MTDHNEIFIAVGNLLMTASDEYSIYIRPINSESNWYNKCLIDSISTVHFVPDSGQYCKTSLQDSCIVIAG